MQDQDPRRPWLPYVAPMFVFLLLTALESLLPGAEDGGGTSPFAYKALYLSKIILVSLTAWLCRSTWRDLRFRGVTGQAGGSPGAGTWVAAFVVGLLVYAAWVGLHGRYPEIPILGGRTGYDPSDLDGVLRIPFLAVRFYGLVLLVPLIEEIFWRSFLMRWVESADFTKLPIAAVTLKGAVVTSVCFAIAHPEWLPALLTGVAWAILLRRTQSLAACLVSHIVANLALGIHVLATGSWWFL